MGRLAAYFSSTTESRSDRTWDAVGEHHLDAREYSHSGNTYMSALSRELFKVAASINPPRHHQPSSTDI
jgi:hypothetical protein